MSYIQQSYYVLDGPQTGEPLDVTWQKAEPDPLPRVLFRDSVGLIVDLDRNAMDGTEEIDGEATRL